MYQSCTIVGRLGQDPDVRMTQNGNSVAKVSVAVSEKWKGKDDKMEERTEWFSVVAWGKLAEIIGKYCKKGDLNLFAGRMQTQMWEKDGQKHYKTELIANEMKMLSGKKDSNGGQNTDSYAQSAPPNRADDDCPF